MWSGGGLWLQPANVSYFKEFNRERNVILKKKKNLGKI